MSGESRRPLSFRGPAARGEASSPAATDDASSSAVAGGDTHGGAHAARRALLRVEDLRVSFATEEGELRAVEGVSFELAPGRTLGLVGESGSGKSVTALTLLGLTRDAGGRVQGRVWFAGRELVGLPERELRAIRGDRVAMVFQDPLSSLHPMHRVGAQIVEAIRAHRAGVSRAAARARAIELLEEVGIAKASTRVESYPHELSGGQRQRVMIAMALAGDPDLLVADEPTTALDVTVQAQILALLARLQRERGLALVLVTHDLGVVGELADEIAVMYAGRIVERAPAARLFDGPEHPYTWGLLRSMPTLAGPRAARLQPIPGTPPSPLAHPPGCSFHPRCPHAQPEHARTVPALQAVPGERAHEVACLLAPEVRRRLWREPA